MERDGHQFPVFVKDDLPGGREQAENALQESLQVQHSGNGLGVSLDNFCTTSIGPVNTPFIGYF
jgi:hypothetical protein